MIKKRSFIVLIISALIATIGIAQQEISNEFIITKKWQPLLDKELSNWEKFVGVPHTSVELEGHPKSDDITKGTPLGLNNDVKNVMSMIEENGEFILYITGEIYAGLTSLQEFENYHLKAYFKWGEKKWEPRLDKKRDNGILYHCKGEHGAFWNVWMQSLECQVQESDMGDFVALLGVNADIKSEITKENYYQTTPDSKKFITYGAGQPAGYCHIYESNEYPNGEWNLIEVICFGDKSIHVVNGKVVMVVHNAKQLVDGESVPLTSGKIQIQSEGAEAYYKNISIKSIKGFPKNYKKQAGL